MFCADDLLKPHGSIWVVRMWCDMHIDPVLRCFDNLEWLSYRDLLVSVVSELVSWLTI
jgi:hypothetical protein